MLFSRLIFNLSVVRPASRAVRTAAACWSLTRVARYERDGHTVATKAAERLMDRLSDPGCFSGPVDTACPRSPRLGPGHDAERSAPGRPVGGEVAAVDREDGCCVQPPGNVNE